MLAQLIKPFQPQLHLSITAPLKRLRCKRLIKLLLCGNRPGVHYLPTRTVTEREPCPASEYFEFSAILSFSANPRLSGQRSLTEMQGTVLASHKCDKTCCIEWQQLLGTRKAGDIRRRKFAKVLGAIATDLSGFAKSAVREDVSHWLYGSESAKGRHPSKRRISPGTIFERDGSSCKPFTVATSLPV